MRKRTVRSAAELSGVGIHTGVEVAMRIHPSPAGGGIRFIRTDKGCAQIAACRESVVSTERRTGIGADIGGELVTVSTIEHFMAACMVAGVFNLLVEIDGPEVPIMDGTAGPFMDLIESAGIVDLEPEERAFHFETELLFNRGPFVLVKPYDSPLVASYSWKNGLSEERERQYARIDFGDDPMGTFRRELAMARSPCWIPSLEGLQSRGLALGVDLGKNCMPFDADGRVVGHVNCPDEAARHKLVDLLGDLALVSGVIHGSVFAHGTGHRDNALVASAANLRRASQ